MWICLDPQGHLQATGVDAAGRRQYRYHDQWRARRDAAKFEHMLEVAAGLAARGLSRERVLAAATRLLDTAVIRAGGEGYAQDDPVLGEATFGLATLRRDHVSVTGDTTRLCDGGSGGQPRAHRLCTHEDRQPQGGGAGDARRSRAAGKHRRRGS